MSNSLCFVTDEDYQRHFGHEDDGPPRHVCFECAREFDDPLTEDRCDACRALHDQIEASADDPRRV